MYQIPQAILDEFQIDPDIPVVFPDYLLSDMERYASGDSSMMDVYSSELESSLHLAWLDGYMSEQQMMWLREYFGI